MKLLNYLLIISCLVLAVSSTTLAMDFSGELITNLSYSHIEAELPPAAKSDLELTSNTKLKLGASGLYRSFQYDLELEGSGKDFSGQLNHAVVTTTAGPTLWELGYRAWNWGQGFSFSPTYPFADKATYTGLEANTMFNNYNLTWGTTLDSSHEQLQSSWLRLNKLLATSDYTVVASYLKDSSELNIPVGEEKKTGFNLGLNYSKDFLNGLELHSGVNFRSWQKEDLVNQQYLIGGQYNTGQNKIILLEYYRKVDDYLTFILRNQGTITTDWHWEFREVLNVDDYGEIRNFDLSYTGLDRLTPKVEIDNFSGPGTSQIKEKPMNWTINFKLTANL